LATEPPAPEQRSGGSQTVSGTKNNSFLFSGDIKGDFYFKQVNQVADGQFATLTLESFGPERWVDPPRACELLEVLHEHRLLVLSGEMATEDKSDCARHLARRLDDSLSPASPTQSTQVLERFSSKEPQRIEEAFQEDSVTILLLLDVSPATIIGYNPLKLKALLDRHQSYIIMTTDTGRSGWGFPESGSGAQQWRELDWKAYYGTLLLSEFLIRQLIDSPLPCPAGLLPEGSEGSLLVAGIAIADAVDELRSPARVRSFAEWMLKQSGPLKPDRVADQLKQLRSDSQAVGYWYRQLDNRQQLLAMGLVLLDGLSENLLFAGLESLVERIWRRSDPLLPYFDYCDLTQLSAYFPNVPTDEGSIRIQSRSSEHRRLILTAAWDLQRRRLLGTLPALTEMIRASADQASSDYLASAEKSSLSASNLPASNFLYTSRGEQQQLHLVLSESLGLIGLLSIQVVEPHLLKLASDASSNVQQFVARALAAWRADNQEKALFRILHRWWSDSRISSASELSAQAKIAVRSTVARTVGFAARFDRSNHLAPPLLSILEQLALEPKEGVKEALSELTLPLVVIFHFRQVESWLRKRILLSFSDRDFIYAVAFGAAEACHLRPEESLSILDTWRTDSHQSSPSGEVLAVTAILAYGYIRCQDDNHLLSAQAICARLRSTLLEEECPSIRRAVFQAIAQLTRQNFEVFSQLLQELVAEIDLADRPDAIQVFKQTYLWQRLQLTGGDRTVQIDGGVYALWKPGTRPLTDIEGLLYSWLLDTSCPSAQQIAVDVFDALSQTPVDQSEAQLSSENPLQIAISGVSPGEKRSAVKLHMLSLLGSLALRTARTKPEVQATLQPLLAEMIALLQKGQWIRLWTILNRWKQMPENAASRVIAQLLHRPLTHYRWRWLWITVIASLAFLAYHQVPRLYQAAAHAIQADAPAPAFQPESAVEQTSSPSGGIQ
jgi:hypothetical protein